MPILDPAQFAAGHWQCDFAFGRCRPTDDPATVAFLHALSRAILAESGARRFPDLMTLGYFCRKSNMARALAQRPDIAQCTGWGTVLHIAPSNIPINFGFSLVMGLAAGNSNIVRVPSRLFEQMTLFVALFDRVAQASEFSTFTSQTAFVQTNRDDPALDGLVARADGLVVWGGDATVARFRALPKMPRCVEVYFPDRVSAALLDAPTIAAAAPDALETLANQFFNDTFLVDQNACSSPGLVFWRGSEDQMKAAQAVFWPAVAQRLQGNYSLDPVARLDRALDVMRMARAKGHPVTLHANDAAIWRLEGAELRDQLLRFGTFLEVTVPDIAACAPYLRPNEQTLTVFGPEPGDVFAALKGTAARLDRIVPVGRALDIGLNWDGRDMLTTLSRRVELG
ncbi:acyl-CoA reductase [Ruegeria arenilitoris]|uniref:acyl-CoA reductase n=1 Tax=Ruegeria arenilitoris TaxID=1173585 RepID=UPI001C98DBBE|nr:acyl-CoA reductase [Ruegeria arenilitoris]MBY6081857.1 hypothetical protein [Ruegeria arenilitoris]